MTAEDQSDFERFRKLLDRILTRFWPPALPEWSTRSVRDAFYASPKFPRLLKPDSVKDTISRGLDAGSIAYVGKTGDGRYEPFVYRRSLGAGDIEIADDMYLIVRERAEEYAAKKAAGTHPTGGATQPASGGLPPADSSGQIPTAGAPGGHAEPPPASAVPGFQWAGEVSPQKWMNFYTKVLSRFATAGGLEIRVGFKVRSASGLSRSQLDEVRVALRELGLSEDLEEDSGPPAE